MTSFGSCVKTWAVAMNTMQRYTGSQEGKYSHSTTNLIRTFLSESKLLLAYLFSVQLEHFNILNVSLQGMGHNTYFFQIEYFRGRLYMFPSICHEMQQLNSAGRNAVTKAMTAHLAKLRVQFHDCFPEKHRNDECVGNSFRVNVKNVMLQRGKLSWSSFHVTASRKGNAGC